MINRVTSTQLVCDSDSSHIEVVPDGGSIPEAWVQLEWSSAGAVIQLQCCSPKCARAAIEKQFGEHDLRLAARRKAREEEVARQEKERLEMKPA